ncbi:MAG: tRNA1(Val) (adenine(37)-N6)-methyltransferase [Prevotella sp.]|jgi:tRNA1Val (adenine37-N6)-methyltransferase
MSNDTFQFQQFTIHQDQCAMKVGTDGVLLGAWAEGGTRILDVGCATGIISLMMAQRFPAATVTGIDIDEMACQQAKENVAASQFCSRIRIECAALQDWTDEMYDCIVSNPPFFVNSLTSPNARRTLARHSDTLPFDQLFASVGRLLTNDGVFSAIVPVEVEESFTSEAYLKGFRIQRRLLVKTTPRKQPKRVLLAFGRSFAAKSSEEMFGENKNLMDSDGSRSEWYSNLTREFYVK